MTEALETTFQGIKIGIKDHKGIELFNGDTIEIEVSENVVHKGEIVYDYGAFCLKFPRREPGLYNIFPLHNYASYCKITKIK